MKRFTIRVLRCVALSGLTLVVLPFIAGADPKVDIAGLFSPSGYMGDGEYGTEFVQLAAAHADEFHSAPTAIRVDYQFGRKRWAGIYWLNRPNNWGDHPGNDYSQLGISRVVFWAKGKTGTELVEFKTGDVRNPDKPNRDSYAKTLGRIRLSKQWTKYEIDLSGADLSSVIGGFAWVASSDFNTLPKITFYLDDVAFE